MLEELTEGLITSIFDKMRDVEVDISFIANILEGGNRIRFGGQLKRELRILDMYVDTYFMEGAIESLNDYQKKAQETAVYPDVGKNIDYPFKGFVDEFGELLEKLSLNQDFRLELGDCYWYTAMICFESGLTLQQVDDLSATVGHSFDPVVSLNISLGKIAGMLKKLERDGTPVDKGALLSQLAEVWYYLHTIVGPVEVLDICQENNLKLSSRKERNVLQGSGDYR